MFPNCFQIRKLKKFFKIKRKKCSTGCKKLQKVSSETNENFTNLMRLFLAVPDKIFFLPAKSGDNKNNQGDNLQINALRWFILNICCFQLKEFLLISFFYPLIFLSAHFFFNLHFFYRVNWFYHSLSPSPFLFEKEKIKANRHAIVSTTNVFGSLDLD